MVRLASSSRTSPDLERRFCSLESFIVNSGSRLPVTGVRVVEGSEKLHLGSCSGHGWESFSICFVACMFSPVNSLFPFPSMLKTELAIMVRFWIDALSAEMELYHWQNLPRDGVPERLSDCTCLEQFPLLSRCIPVSFNRTDQATCARLMTGHAIMNIINFSTTAYLLKEIRQS